MHEFMASAILVAQDLDRAKQFYTEKLGLKKTWEMPGVAMFEAGKGSQVVLYEKAGSTAPTTTVLGFDVTNVDSLLADLKAKGVEQDMDDLPEGTDENGVMNYGDARSAWIKDSEGNIIALNEMSARS